MRRWGQISETKSDEWYFETAADVYRPDIYLEAARLLVDDDKASQADFPWDSDGFKAATPASDIIDGIGYDGRAPNAYIDSLPIGLKSGQTVLDGEIQG
jgi:nitrate/nitrite transport system substrate-binding protein